MKNFKKFLALCFFKQIEPEITDEHTSLHSAIFFYGVIAWAIQGYVEGFGEGLIATVLEILLTLAFAGAVVIRKKIIEDFVPLCCAIFICAGFMGCLSLPFTLMIHMVKGKLAMFFIYSLVALVVWNILITKHIFQKFVMLRPMKSLALAIFYFMIAYAMPFVGLVIF